MPDSTPAGNEQALRLLFDTCRMYHDALRNEILYKMRVQDQMAYMKIAVFAAAVLMGLIRFEAHVDPSIAPFMYVLPLGLALLLDLVIFQNLRTLLDAGRYLREQVEETWMAPVKAQMRQLIGDREIEFWEERVAAIRRKTTQFHFNAADIAQLVLTLTVALYCAAAINEMMGGTTMASAVWASRCVAVLVILYLVLVVTLYLPMMRHTGSK